MSGQELYWERPECLRERARWYRTFASTHEDAAWALQLASLLERQADALDAAQAAHGHQPATPGDER